jgi:tetratricopeptide (TPR) repeat protein
MASKKKGHQSENLEAVEHALTRTEQAIEENQRPLTIIVIALIVLLGVFLGVKKFVISPKEKEAQAQIFMAESYFEKDSFNLALNGDGNYLGVLDIIDNYKITKTAKLAHYYAGISYLRLEQYQDAIDYLQKFKSKDDMIKPIAVGAIGDAYAELDNFDKAITNYLHAANTAENSFLTPLFLQKAGELLEMQEKSPDALKHYERIKVDYPDSNEGRQIDKYIARAKLTSK